MTTTQTPPPLPPHINLIDTHCHLDMAAYDQDREEVISLAQRVRVTRLLTIGIDLESSQKAVALAESHQSVYAAVGVHPHNVSQSKEFDYERIIELAALPKVVAYGEIGLDFVKPYSPIALQIKHFRHQLQLAKRLNLPVVIHDRGAHKEIVTVLREEAPFPARGVMHCFSGDRGLAREVLDLEFYISIPGIVTFGKATELQDAARYTPISSLLLETDCPFLAPVPKRGKRNKPEYLTYTALKIAELKNISLEEIALKTTENAEALFLFDD